MSLRLIAAMLLLLLCGSAHAEDPLMGAEQRIFEQKAAAMLAVRTDAYRFAEENGILNADRPLLTREQSNRLRRLAAAYLQARAALMPYAERAGELFLYDSPRLVHDQPTRIDSLVQYGSPEEWPKPEHLINPQDEAGQRAMREIMRGLAASMVLWDSYRIGVLPYERSSGMQYTLTYDVESEHSLRVLANNYYSPDLRTRLVNATHFVDRYVDWRRREQRPANAEEEYLYALIQSTLWYADIRDGGGIRPDETMRYVAGDLHLHRKSMQNILSYGLSMGFGNMIGLVQTRSGHLKALSEQEIEALASQLRPLDLLLEKTPFRLTDKMIPGHYGHVAVWLGSEEELRALGVWDRIPYSYQEQIKKGGRIVEALRSGVVISTLPHFLNIDDLLVLRDRRNLSDEYRREAVLVALQQVGKEYDFNFDVYTHKRIVCSELAYVVFPDVPWPLAQTLGRYTISPDNVAQMALQPTQIFEPVIIYRDGERVEQGLSETLSELIAAEKEKLFPQGEARAAADAGSP